MEQGSPAQMLGQVAMRPAVATARKSFVGKLAGAVASHAHLSLAIIIVLLILVVGLVVYYRGFLFLGPYARRHKPSHKKKDDGEASGGAAEAAGDPETEKLIESINRH